MENHQLIAELASVKSELERLRWAAIPFTEAGRFHGSKLWRNRHGLRHIMSNAQIARDKLFYALNPDAPEYGDPYAPETLPSAEPLPSSQDKDR